MNVAAHQEKKKSENTGKGKAGKERKQTVDFKEAACCPSAVDQRQRKEKMTCVREVPGVTGTLGRPYHYVELAVNWYCAESFGSGASCVLNDRRAI